MFSSVLALSMLASCGVLAVPQRPDWGRPTTSAPPPPAATSPPAAAAPPASAPPAGSTPVAPPASSAPASPPGGGGEAAGGGGESHLITINNNCGGGTPMFAYAANRGGQAVQGSVTINGPVDSGIAWMSGTEHNCGFDGTGCGFMEFTIANSMMNSADYSLLTTGLGDHYFKYAMDFRFTGECTDGPGKCTSGTSCPGAYTGTVTFSGKPTTCGGQNVGITITFC
ncbi:uncharacterized protein I303_103259 [Kwoniella dejecticola CBS 10117]|uniref:Uncharacterized protein n=1 Tax=Kwoniella dejecticola CBS 10117 TaxID=1296121 RepID=A0A1A6AB24_9TREE|nr:uncharacterized protein I303_03282 [Kwoniella dejecticola CBS 10117]OBR87257.1 hypothetical protein I303_03282 [Kwoniella dejecticola CBS 10117]